MIDEEVDDPWLCTLATRLRAHYGAAAAGPGPGQQAEDRLRAELAARIDALRRLTAGGGRYRIVATIDRGGMGQVAQAYDAALGRTVAIKQVAPVPPAGDGAAAEARRLRLLAEAAIVGRLQHPGIVPIHDVGIDAGGAPFFAMPRIAGRTLAAILGRGGADRDPSWTLARSIEVVRRVCETMAYAHARGVAHRDLKPANVMVGDYGEVYVVDWGLARSRGDPGSLPGAPADAEPGLPGHLTVTGTVLGTPAYMPPERALAPGGAHEGRPDVQNDLQDDLQGDVQADVYGTGAMLYEVLAGAPPYARERGDWTVASILAAIRAGPPRALREVAPHVDPELAAVCARAMHRDPGRRYRDMQSLADDLRAWAEHRIVGAHGAGPARRLAKWVRRNRPLAAGLAAAAAVVLASSVWFVARVAAARDTAQANLREILDLAVVQQVRDLRLRADTGLWPATAGRTGAMHAWLGEAEQLRPTLGRLCARRDALSAEGGPGAAGGGARPAAEAAFRRRLLDDAIAALDAFFAPAPSPPASGAPPPLGSSVADVAARVAAAAELTLRSVGSAEARERWRAAAAQARADPRYAGLELRPQPGLLPIGRDPATGLLEFAHLHSGAPAARGADGRLQVRPGDGLALVLLPGGAFWMGAGPEGPHNVDPLAEPINELPVHRVRLAPFLIAKFEMTQAQWQRVAGSNPSVHTAVSDYVRAADAPLHPVESVDWWQAREVLHKLGLSLPTEAQWEYAARAGTSTPWCGAPGRAGARIEDLLRPPAGNLADAASAAALGAQGWMPTPGLDDGYVMHAPVGSFPPNAFGLHDVLGNVWEWCEDEYVSYRREPAADTGARPRSAVPETVMYRGGAFDQPAQEARSANRAGAPPTRRHFALGLRPARRLDGP